MIPTNFKRAAASVAVSAIVLLASGPALADTWTVPPTTVPTKEGGTFTDEGNACARILVLDNTMQVRLNALSEKLEERVTERETRLAEMRKKQQEAVSDHRQAWDTRWDKLLLDLQAKASTDAEKAAVAQFRLDMVTAFSARKTAIENANTAFRSGLDQAITARRTDVKTAVERLTTAVKSAFETARVACTANMADTTVRARLKTNLEAAYAKYRLSIQEADKIGEKVKALVQARTAAFEKANADFKAAAAKARAELKAKLKV